MSSLPPRQCPRSKHITTTPSKQLSTEATEEGCLKGNSKVRKLKPQHVSLGKCAACHQFTHLYSSVNHSDIVDLLRVGCTYNGFKNIASESPEEEGFVTMHHVLLLSTLDGSEIKELCVQRTNDYTIDTTIQLKEENFVVSDHDSVVILVSKPLDNLVDAFYFGKHTQARLELDVADDVECDVRLERNVLFMRFDELEFMLVVCFSGDESYARRINFHPSTDILTVSSIMLVTNDSSPCSAGEDQDSHDERLHIEHIDTAVNRDMSVTSETKNRLIHSKIVIFSVFHNVIWLSITNMNIQVYSYSRSKDLNLLDSFEVKSCFDSSNDNDVFVFVSFTLSTCSMQGFLLYIRNTNSDGVYNNNDKISLILVMDLRSLKIVGVLEMELTLNRDPQLKMFPSRDGSKLFVQERFENRVIFYQVFSLTSTDLSLSSIVKRYLWKNFQKTDVINAGLPSRLSEEVLLGF